MNWLTQPAAAAKPPADPTEGRKDDTAKDRWDLLPLEAVRAAVRVLTFGARKYADRNYLRVDSAEDRYFAALMRHLVARRTGQVADEETGEDHYAHAMANLLILMQISSERT